MIDSDRLRQALANALESNEGIPPARNGRATIDGVEYTAVPVAELERLRAIEKRAQHARAMGSSVGEIEAAAWILNGDPS